jgi:hypothetical protein
MSTTPSWTLALCNGGGFSWGIMALSPRQLEGAYLAAVEGMGIVLMTLLAFRREFASGALVQVMRMIALLNPRHG